MVNFALEFLHVAMRDILIARILLVSLFELLLETSLRLYDFLFNFFDNNVVVLAFADLDKDAFLEFEHWGLNDSMVEVDHVGRYLTLEIRILVHDWFELIFAETVGIDVVERSVEELGFVTEKVFIASDDGLVTQFDMEVLLVGVAEPDAVLAILLLGFLEVFRNDIDLLIDFFIFFKYVLLYHVEARFKILK